MNLALGLLKLNRFGFSRPKHEILQYFELYITIYLIYVIIPAYTKYIIIMSITEKTLTKQYPVSLTSTVKELLGSPGIAKQFLATNAELVVQPEELVDPIGDNEHSPVKGLVHRYPDRVLLKPISVCPVYCRFCFRRETVGKEKSLTPHELENCYEYIRNNNEIFEVILSGGDPLFMKPASLAKIFNKINAIEHVEVVRIHTRVPSVAPELINTSLLKVLSSRTPVYVVVHMNHPDEFTIESIAALNALVDSGVVLLSQSVLLKGINDNIKTLGKLMRLFVKHRVKPYYLHHPDLAPGTSHFRVSIEQGQELIRQLHGRFSGLAQVQYVLDIPGGYGKSPIGPNYLSMENGNYRVVDYQGCVHSY
ncbi:MAG: lysine-2,3-aminomutase-like protein [Francisellaceae bacterium]|nr:lysine-2,3-aminomutase-like protein [Francisellaceae bacterium]